MLAAIRALLDTWDDIDSENTKKVKERIVSKEKHKPSPKEPTPVFLVWDILISIAGVEGLNPNLAQAIEKFANDLKNMKEPLKIFSDHGGDRVALGDSTGKIAEIAISEADFAQPLYNFIQQMITGRDWNRNGKNDQNQTPARKRKIHESFLEYRRILDEMEKKFLSDK